MNFFTVLICVIATGKCEIYVPDRWTVATKQQCEAEARRFANRGFVYHQNNLMFFCDKTTVPPLRDNELHR